MSIYWKIAAEILILWFAIYQVIIFFERARAAQFLRGIGVLLFAYVLFMLFRRFGFHELEWLSEKLFGISVIAVLVIFHPEIRQGLAQLGRRSIFGAAMGDEGLERMFIEISRAADSLIKNKLGALIVIEKDDPLDSYIENGVLVDAAASSDLIEAIFTPNNPLHDGGIIIRNSRVAAAGCLFPLTQNKELSRIFGTRHRAALGLSEEADAVVIVVSEERRDISLVYRGMLYKDITREELLNKVKNILNIKAPGERANIVYRLKHCFTFYPWIKVISFMLAIIAWSYLNTEIMRIGH